MKTFTLRLLIALLTFLCGVAVASVLKIYFNPKITPSTRVVPAIESTISNDSQWQTVIRDRFSFDLPGDMEPLLGHKEESGARSYSNGHGLQIIYWYGSRCIYPIPPSVRSANEQIIVIDRVRAKSGVDTFVGSDLRIAYVCFFPSPANSSRLSMMAYTHDQEAVETAQKIFNSVRFRK